MTASGIAGPVGMPPRLAEGPRPLRLYQALAIGETVDAENATRCGGALLPHSKAAGPARRCSSSSTMRSSASRSVGVPEGRLLPDRSDRLQLCSIPAHPGLTTLE